MTTKSTRFATSNQVGHVHECYHRYNESKYKEIRNASYNNGLFYDSMFGGNAPENAQFFRRAHDFFRPQSRTSRFPRIPSPSADCFGCACLHKECFQAHFQRRTRIDSIFESKKRAQFFEIDLNNSASEESRTARQTKTSSFGPPSPVYCWFTSILGFLLKNGTMA